MYHSRHRRGGPNERGGKGVRWLGSHKVTRRFHEFIHLHTYLTAQTDDRLSIYDCTTTHFFSRYSTSKYFASYSFITVLCMDATYLGTDPQFAVYSSV